ncbi:MULTISPECIES: hypothetical protein [Desulfobacula]|uniref:Conserved uncharacterized protein n=2 Tax=Desulfobacula TaxID=28222 RepID=K0NQ98_DESTT|nr:MULTISPECIES: hypothetical protein [Desulfobacula]CCK81042.1 conserved uncharacterized protein [Desulfobacula toluolica Tol2]SDU35417.1 hypothetical protein SAMN04487931_10749 [Desulfobacula phenolica]
MIANIRVHSKVEKAIQQMANQDNAPKIAALRAQKIIDTLIKGCRISHVGKFSRKKDLRIKNVFKFNLGKGYRLVSIKEQDILYILFIGDHDQCDRWLDTYRKKRPHKIPIPLNIYGVSSLNKNNPKKLDYQDIKHDDAKYLPEITQEDLRKVFCGIVSNS